MAIRYRIGCTLGLMLGSMTLQAAEPPAAPVSNNGLMTFPNVRVENAPIPAKAAKRTATRQPGMMAYIDKNGQLLEAPEGVASPTSTANTVNRTLTGTGTSTVAAAATTLEEFYGPENAVGVTLDETSMVFQVAHLGADGKLSQECVTGEGQAKQTVQSPTAAHNHAAHTHEDSRNDR